MDPDIIFLKKTLKLARRGMGWVNPNPMVGAVVVKDGVVIGRGYHKKAGSHHAEVEAIRQARLNPSKLDGATLYVNLEPCGHFGKTPPCTDAIISSGIKKVVCCTLDPNPKVSGKGIQILKDAGVKVIVEKLTQEALVLNEAFFTFHTKKRPFIAIKFASSLDGKIATKTNDSKWITNVKARDCARGLRGKYQAILVGINTVLADDPHLGVRTNGKKDPLRIILDSNLKIPLDCKVLRDSNVLIATTEKADQVKLELLKQKGVSIITFKGDDISLDKLLKELYKREIISILVEGGSSVLGSFCDQKLVDKVYAFYAPILIGGEGAKTTIGGIGVNKISEAIKLRDFYYQKFNDNFLIIGYAI